jgi:hypothetical protein
MDAWMVAIDHGLQLTRKTNDSGRTPLLKYQFGERLRSGIPERAVSCR